MVITLKFEGQQQLFHYYWLPLMYKHNECKFVVEDKTSKLVYPKDVNNLEVIANINNVKLHTYRKKRLNFNAEKNGN